VRADIEAAWERFLVSKGNPLDILSIANQHLQLTAVTQMPADEKDFVIEMLNRVISIAATRTRERAKANRMLGEIALSLGDKSGALSHFRSALSDDSKIGVSLIARRLEKETKTNPPAPP
jgi:lipopolysaccharide biosynthesis regulator YciM